MLNEQDFDVVKETKRQCELEFVERMLDGLAVMKRTAENEAVVAAQSAGKDMPAVVSLLLGMTVAKATSACALAMCLQIGLPRESLTPAALDERYFNMKREGRLR